MNKEEYTEQFDLERFKNGEPAFSVFTDRLFRLIEFKPSTGKYAAMDHYGNSSDNALEWMKGFWRMKPKTDGGQGWIQVVDGKFPVHINAGDLKRFSSEGEGEEFAYSHVKGESAGDIIAYRLTNGWINCDGKTMPVELNEAEDFELCFRDGTRGMNSGPVYMYEWEHHGHVSDIVAVRLVKKESKTISLGLVTADTVTDIALEALGKKKKETEKQRLTREAWQRYKAKHPTPVPYIPMRADEQFEIAAVAISAFEAELERKRGK